MVVAWLIKSSKRQCACFRSLVSNLDKKSSVLMAAALMLFPCKLVNHSQTFHSRQATFFLVALAGCATNQAIDACTLICK